MLYNADRSRGNKSNTQRVKNVDKSSPSNCQMGLFPRCRIFAPLFVDRLWIGLTALAGVPTDVLVFKIPQQTPDKVVRNEQGLT